MQNTTNATLEFSKDDGFKISLEVFEGPFDVLLGLIEAEKLAIYDISISKITNSYLEYLHQLQALDLEVSGKFLEMAAFLIELKSKMLLPAENPDNQELLAEAEQEKTLLLERLIEYKAFKNLTRSLLQRENDFAHVHTRADINAEYLNSLPQEKNIVIKNADLELLVKAFNRIWQNFELRLLQSPYQLAVLHTYPIKDKMHEIIERIKNSKTSMLFSEFFQDIDNRYEIIATFVGMLELVRQQFILIVQNAIFDDIELVPRKNVETQALEFDAAEYNLPQGESENAGTSA
ncbi:MAG: segregation/condensation protein A [Candidatus Margulisbacteria bacterium]|jgi:segregation and condensation protein A|nr:segregation/condensation protein A [Candidatus Margulisiibacteriota bacterium]